AERAGVRPRIARTILRSADGDRPRLRRLEGMDTGYTLAARAPQLVMTRPNPVRRGKSRPPVSSPRRSGRARGARCGSPVETRLGRLDRGPRCPRINSMSVRA